jgi:hypothetical protein
VVGKGSLIIILGFSIIFSVASQYWNRESNSAVDNFVGYYDTTMAHNIAISAANIACDTVFFGGWKDTLPGNMPSGTFSGGGSSASSGSFTTSATRINYGGTFYLLVTAVGSYASMHGLVIKDTVQVLFQPSFFSGYAFFTNNENSVNWVTGDTVYGPFHTNGSIYFYGYPAKPVFFGRATWAGNTYVNGSKSSTPFTANSKPSFYGGWQQGSATYVTIPTDISGISASASQVNFTGSSSYTGNNYAYDVYLTFNSNGTVTITDTTRKSNSGSWSVVNYTSPQTISLSSIQDPYGQVVITVRDGDVHVKGMLSGNVTVAAFQGATSPRTSYTGRTQGTPYFGTNDGNVLIDGNIVYKNDPQINPGSTDMLGLVADNNVALVHQKNPGNVTIDGAIFAKNGSFSYLGYSNDEGSTSNGSYNTFYGFLNVYGSITQNSRGAVGTVTGTGYLKNYKFDNRFYATHPPSFPSSPNRFRIISWRE